jgi:type IV secretory pathway TraG/TraD family ATPase VirD4
VTSATTVRRLAPPDAVRRIRPGEGVLLYRDLPPIRLALRPWYDDPGLRDLAGEDAARRERSATSMLPPTRR